MARSGQKQTSNPRREARGQRAAWVGPFRRVRRTLQASLRMIDAILCTVAASDRCKHRRPLRATQELDDASDRLVLVSVRLEQVVKGIREVTDCIARQPERAGDAPALLLEATHQFLFVAGSLSGAARELFGLQEDLLARLRSGELVPEAAEPRRRIVIAPRPTLIRAFLRARQPRLVDRISPLLQRRRRTRLPRTIRVPRRTSQGRAPPLVPACLL